MSQDSNYVNLPFSKGTFQHGVKIVNKIRPGKKMTIGLRLRSRSHQQINKMIDDLVATPLANRTYLSVAEYKEMFSASLEDIEIIHNFANKFSLTVDYVNINSRLVHLRGTVKNFNEAFQTQLERRRKRLNWHIGYSGMLSLPVEVAEIVSGVFGMNTRSAGGRLIRSEGFKRRGKPKDLNTVPEITEIYNFPEEKGKGQNIALVELGGGYKKRDLTKYFDSLGMKIPNIVVKPLNNSKMKTGLFNAFEQLEMTTDIAILGAAAPEANLIVYFNDAGSSNLDFSWAYLETICEILLDEEYQCKVISTSWGDIEEKFDGLVMKEINKVFAEAALLGITVCASTGDYGSEVISNDEGKKIATVHFPASSPFVLGVGGTMVYSDSNKSELVKETAWNESDTTIFWLIKATLAGGGGISNVFNMPKYQENKGVPRCLNPGHRRGRGVPDVSANAGINTGYRVWLWGIKMSGVGGTSCAAPVWAALIARINQSLDSPVGLINPHLYEELSKTDGLKPVTEGNNHLASQNTDLFYTASPGWNPCTGFGSPNGKALLQAIKNAHGIKRD